jgi:hypothetical protein
MSGLKPPTYGERVVEGLMSGLKPPTYGGWVVDGLMCGCFVFVGRQL